MSSKASLARGQAFANNEDAPKLIYRPAFVC